MVVLCLDTIQSGFFLQKLPFFQWILHSSLGYEYFLILFIHKHSVRCSFALLLYDRNYLTDLDIVMMPTVVQHCWKISCLPSTFVLRHDFYYLPVSLLCYIFLFSMKVFLKFERACNLLITDNYSFIVYVLLWYYTFIVQNLWSTKFSFFCNIQSDDEREMCARTVYCTNIDKKVYLFLEKLQNKYFW